MSKKSLKEKITQAVIEQLPASKPTVDEAMSKWWSTMRQDNGLRLNDLGDMSFRLADIEFYEHTIEIVPDVSWQQFMLDLSRKINCPYYLGVNKKDNKKAEPYIRLYDSKIAMMLNLYGDIHSYLKSIKVRK
jgi:hypothetical protein